MHYAARLLCKNLKFLLLLLVVVYVFCRDVFKLEIRLFKPNYVHSAQNSFFGASKVVFEVEKLEQSLLLKLKSLIVSLTKLEFRA